MIYDLSDDAQKQAFDAEMARHRLLYGCIFFLRIGGRRVLLIEPWNPGAAVA